MTVVVGEQIQGVSGLWAPAPTSYTYQWQDSLDGVSARGDIAGATRSDYIAVANDEAHWVRCGVTATNAGGSSSVSYSAWVGPIGVYVAPPDPNGHATFPDLTVTADAWESYQRRRHERPSVLWGTPSPPLWDSSRKG